MRSWWRRRARRVRKGLWTPGLALVMVLAFLGGSASAAGGSNIATAPTILFGQHTFGTTATGEWDCGPAEFWNLALLPGDQATIDWGAAQRQYAWEAVIFPAGTTDFSINNVEPLNRYFVGENNKAEAVFSSGTGGNFPLIFAAEGCDDDHPAGPYDFTVTDQHAITISLQQYPHIKPTTVVHATANLVNGAPVPDGSAFTLQASWAGSVLTYTATSVAGGLSFPLALPEAAEGQTVTLVVSRGPDGNFLEAKSASYEVRVSRPPVVPVITPCAEATRHARSLGRRHTRLVDEARGARGRARARLRHHAHVVGRNLRAARAAAGKACA